MEVQTTKLLSLPEVENLVRMKKSWIYEKIQEGLFPEEYRKFGHRSLWSLEQILHWINHDSAQLCSKGTK